MSSNIKGTVEFEKIETVIMTLNTKDLESFRAALNLLINIKSNYGVILNIKTSHDTNNIIVESTKEGFKKHSLDNFVSDFGDITTFESESYVIYSEDILNALESKDPDAIEKTYHIINNL